MASTRSPMADTLDVCMKYVTADNIEALVSRLLGLARVCIV